VSVQNIPLTPLRLGGTVHACSCVSIRSRIGVADRLQLNRAQCGTLGGGSYSAALRFLGLAFLIDSIKNHTPGLMRPRHADLF
jgi:hypothetical protein